MAGTALPGKVCVDVPVLGRTATATPDPQAIDSGRRLPRGATLGRYVVLDCLGSGGMGVVYRAHDFALDRRVSLKLLRSSGQDPDARRARLVAEAQALARVSHPNVLAVHDVGTWEGEVYLALEHVEGETLADWLGRAVRTPAEIRGVFLQAGRGLQAIHEADLVHRDFKPENVLIGRDGRVRVADLGLAVTAGGEEASASAETQPGTPGYMPLEQHRGEPLDARADQYSLAVALFEALLGRRPYGSRGATREELQARLSSGEPAEVPRCAAIPPRLRRALSKALSPERQNRLPTLASLLDALASPGIQPSPRLAVPVAAAAAFALALVLLLRAGPPLGDRADRPWTPPALEFQPESSEALALAADAPVEQGTSPATATPEEAPATASTAVQLASVLTPSTRPNLSVVTVGSAKPLVTSWSGGPTRILDATRFAELRALIESLVHTFMESLENDNRPALAAAPGTPGLAGALSAAGEPTPTPQPAALGSTPALEWQDGSAATIAAVERRLNLQIEQHQSTTTIAQTRFALAQTIWNATDAPAAQNRALSLAHQTQADLQTAPDISTVRELRQNVSEWIDSREEGPMFKPGRMTGRPSDPNLERDPANL
jgi:serine/threonine protein kinase